MSCRRNYRSPSKRPTSCVYAGPIGWAELPPDCQRWYMPDGQCRNLIKKPLVSYRAPNRNPVILGIQNQRFLNQVPTLGREDCTFSGDSTRKVRPSDVSLCPLGRIWGPMILKHRRVAGTLSSFLGPKSTRENGPTPLNRTQKPISLHTFEAQVALYSINCCALII